VKCFEIVRLESSVRANFRWQATPIAKTSTALCSLFAKRDQIRAGPTHPASCCRPKMQAIRSGPQAGSANVALGVGIDRARCDQKNIRRRPVSNWARNGRGDQ